MNKREKKNNPEAEPRSIALLEQGLDFKQVRAIILPAECSGWASGRFG